MPLDPVQLAIAASMPGGDVDRIEARMAVVERASRNSLNVNRVEPWHSVSAEAWYSAGWADPAAPSQPPQFYKDSADIVRLRGMALRATALPNPDNILQLPPGYRPSAGVTIPVVVGAGLFGYAQVNPGGFVIVTFPAAMAGTLNATVSLDPIQFRTT